MRKPSSRRTSSTRPRACPATCPSGLPNDTRGEATGRYSDRVGRDPVNDTEIPYLAVESRREVPAPRNRYE
ncbi:hypothetical protein ABT023_19030 [Micromonospora sp. NPDC002296]|uniref:hypothetical protein n=1 Tax=Micromonospora sp. NPDC002296 TaxID=3154271 RepID=UPI00332C6998